MKKESFLQKINGRSDHSSVSSPFYVDRVGVAFKQYLYEALPSLYPNDSLDRSTVTLFYEALCDEYASVLETAHLQRLGVKFTTHTQHTIEKVSLVSDAVIMLGLAGSLAFPYLGVLIAFGSHFHTIESGVEAMAELGHFVLSGSSIASAYSGPDDYKIDADIEMKIMVSQILRHPEKRLIVAHYNALLSSLTLMNILRGIDPSEHQKTARYLGKLFSVHAFNFAQSFTDPHLYNGVQSEDVLLKNGERVQLKQLFLESPIIVWGENRMFVRKVQDKPMPIGCRLAFSNTAQLHDDPVLGLLASPDDIQTTDSILALLSVEEQLNARDDLQACVPGQVDWLAVKAEQIVAEISLKSTPNELYQLFKCCFPVDSGRMPSDHVKNMVCAGTIRARFWRSHTVRGTNLYLAMLAQLKTIFDKHSYVECDSQMVFAKRIINYASSIGWFWSEDWASKPINGITAENSQLLVRQAESLYFYTNNTESSGRDSLGLDEGSVQDKWLEARHDPKPQELITIAEATNECSMQVDDCTSKRNQGVLANEQNHAVFSHEMCHQQAMELFYRSCAVSAKGEYDSLLRWLICTNAAVSPIGLLRSQHNHLTDKEATQDFQDYFYQRIVATFLNGLSLLIPKWASYAASFKWTTPPSFAACYDELLSLTVDRYTHEMYRDLLILSYFIVLRGRSLDLDDLAKQLIDGVLRKFVHNWTPAEARVKNSFPTHHRKAEGCRLTVIELAQSAVNHQNDLLKNSALLSYFSEILAQSEESIIRVFDKNLSELKDFQTQASWNRHERTDRSFLNEKKHKTPYHPAHFLTVLTRSDTPLQNLPLPTFFTLACYRQIAELQPPGQQPSQHQVRYHIGLLLSQQYQILKADDLCQKVNLSVAILTAQYNLTLIHSLMIEHDLVQKDQLDHFNLSFKQYRLFQQRVLGGGRETEELKPIEIETLYALEGVRQIQAVCAKTFEQASVEALIGYTAGNRSAAEEKITQIKACYDKLCIIFDEALCGNMLLFFQKLERVLDIPESGGLDIDDCSDNLEALRGEFTKSKNLVIHDQRFRMLSVGVQHVRAYYSRVLQDVYTKDELDGYSTHELYERVELLRDIQSVFNRI